MSHCGLAPAWSGQDSLGAAQAVCKRVLVREGRRKRGKEKGREGGEEGEGGRVEGDGGKEGEGGRVEGDGGKEGGRRAHMLTC